MAATTTSLLSVQEYLNSVFRPDVDYVDGVLEERNVGEFDHASIQRALLLALIVQERSADVRALQELRVQVSETSFRIPDVCVLPAGLRQQVVTEPPLLCVEVLSPRDTVKAMRQRSEDYLRIGVPEVWIFDPQMRVAYVLNSNGTTEHKGGVLRLQNPTLQVDVEQIFKPLDE